MADSLKDLIQKFEPLFDRYRGDMLQARIASKLGLAEETLNRRKRGKVSFKGNELEDLCKIFKLDPEEAAEFKSLGQKIAELLDPQKWDSQRPEYGHPLPEYDESSPPPNQPPLFQSRLDSYFIGRKEEIALIIKNLQPGQVVAIVGPGGIGKTAVANEVIRALTPNNRLPDNFPDGIGFHNFYQEANIDEALRRLAWQFGVEPSDFPTAQEAITHALFNKQVLIFLDGVDNIRGDLSRILQTLANCGVLLTSQDRRHGRKPYAVLGLRLNDLTPKDALTLLQKWSEGLAKDVSTSVHICDLLGRLPLAIKLAGLYMVNHREDGSGYLNVLKTTKLKGLRFGDRQHESIAVLLRKTLEKLKPEAQKVLEVVGVLNQTAFDKDIIVEGLRGIDVDTIGELQIYHLLKQDDATKLYEVAHPLVHVFAQSELKAPDEVIENLVNYFKWLVTVTKLGSQLYSPDPASLEVIQSMHQKLKTAQAHMASVLTTCMKRKKWLLADDLARVMDLHVNSPSRYVEFVRLQQSAEEQENLFSGKLKEGNQSLSQWQNHGQIAQENNYPEGEFQALLHQAHIGAEQKNLSIFIPTASAARTVARNLGYENYIPMIDQLAAKFSQNPLQQDKRENN